MESASTKDTDKVCSHCSAKVAEDAIFCFNCGHRLTDSGPRDNDSESVDKLIQCFKCKGENNTDAVYCRFCGARLSSEENETNLTSKPSKLDTDSLETTAAEAEAAVEEEKKGDIQHLTLQHAHCVSCGYVLEEKNLLCPKCNAVVPFSPNYELNLSLFEAKGEKKAHYVLRKYKTLQTLSHAFSQRLGKPWLETQFIGSAIQVSETQYTHIKHLALIAGRILGLQHLPDIYVSGSAGWSISTFGTENESFVVIGTFLLKQLSTGELLFCLGRELGHILCGHIFYRTLSLLLSGKTHTTLVTHGLSSLLSLKRLLTLPFQIPLVTWLRATEITADQAGLLVVQDISTAERALLIQSVKSRDVLNNLDLESYVNQQEKLQRNISKLSEFFTQSTPFITQRIRNLRRFYNSNEYASLTQYINNHIPQAELLQIKSFLRSKPGSALSPAKGKSLRSFGKCPKCQSDFSIPRTILLKGKPVMLKCKRCGHVFKVQAHRNIKINKPKNQE